MALVALQRAGYLSYLVSCNIDCLHLRSGYPRAAMAELHGNCFAERCRRCKVRPSLADWAQNFIYKIR